MGEGGAAAPPSAVWDGERDEERRGRRIAGENRRRRVILAGCGHAHLEVVKRAAAFASRDAELVLIDPGRFWYSGLGSGLLGGRFTEAEATIDPRRLAAACGAIFIEDAVTGLDRAAGDVLLRSGGRLAYDLVSFNIGSGIADPAGLGKAAVGVKPIGAIPALRRSLLEARSPQRIVVVGGGATGCEIAGNLLWLKRAYSLEMRVTLVGAAAELMAHAPRGLRQRALRSLTRRGALVMLSDRVVAVEEGGVARLASGGAIGFDHLILATGLVADPLVHRLGLPARESGLRVNGALRSIGDSKIFAAGDCAALEGHDLPKVGVYGVRAGPVLLGNLLAALDGGLLTTFRPQRHALSIVDLADGEALAMRGGFWFAGKTALRLKAHLDRRFLRRYRTIYGAA